MNFLSNKSEQKPKETGGVSFLFNVLLLLPLLHLAFIHIFHTCTLNFCAPIADKKNGDAST